MQTPNKEGYWWVRTIYKDFELTIALYRKQEVKRPNGTIDSWDEITIIGNDGVYFSTDSFEWLQRIPSLEETAHL